MRLSTNCRNAVLNLYFEIAYVFPIVPGEPRQVKVAAINSTAITVRWKPPANKDRNGLIRGYQIHVQEVTNEGDLVNEPKRYDVADENAEEYNVTKLQPETLYAVQVAAVTRKGDGTRSRVKTVKTLGGGRIFYAHIMIKLLSYT